MRSFVFATCLLLSGMGQPQAASDVILHCSGAACAPQIKSLIEEWNQQSNKSQAQRGTLNRLSSCRLPAPTPAKEPGRAPVQPLNLGPGPKGVSR